MISFLRDHPRACGAHVLIRRQRQKSQGSSPRMRGSPHPYPCPVLQSGIIPAHAGLTSSSRIRARLSWDHPRACGAHSVPLASGSRTEGSSPRMRGSLTKKIYFNDEFGIIPAHAGLTYHMFSGKNLQRDHPRACGAHRVRVQPVAVNEGSSPRMRGSLHRNQQQPYLVGIIPAHAGLTLNRKINEGSIRDHPRACGAHAETVACSR